MTMQAHPEFPYRLYLVISEEACGDKPMLEVAERAIKGGVDLIQLREKQLPEHIFLERAQRLKDLSSSYGIPLIINDNPMIASKVRADGIHVGNHDIKPMTLRQQEFFKRKLIGHSIEYLQQLDQEHVAVSDYLGISPVFKTNTKTDTVTAWGLDGMSKIRQLTDKPLVAIGNINIHNARAVLQAGADCLAVVSAICAAEDPQKAAHALKNQIVS